MICNYDDCGDNDTADVDDDDYDYINYAADVDDNDDDDDNNDDDDDDDDDDGRTQNGALGLMDCVVRTKASPAGACICRPC